MISFVLQSTRSIPTAGTISSTGNAGGTMCVTGLKIGASFGCAGKSGRIHVIKHWTASETAAAFVAGHAIRPAIPSVTSRNT